MKLLALPADVPSESVAELRVDEIQLVRCLGLPHDTFHDATQFPGPVAIWAFELDDGMRVVVIFHRLNRLAEVMCDPADADRAVIGLGLPLAVITWRRVTEPS